VHFEYPQIVVAWVCVALVAWLHRTRGKRGWFRTWTLAVTSLLLLAAAASLPTLLAARDSGTAKKNVLELGAYEIGTWIDNPGELNRSRREGLVGVVAWLAILAASLGVAWWERGASSGTAYRVGAVGTMLAALFLVGQIPRAHAVATWGREAPRVLGIAEGCGEAALAAALRESRVDGWLASPGATREYVVVMGGEPLSERRFVPLTHTDGGACAELGAEEVVGSERRAHH